MGGVVGHVQHLGENLSLTFGEIKEVIQNAAQGKLERVSEKLDGLNVVFTYDVSSSALKVARTGSDIKRGGMDAEGLAKKFFGRGNIEDAFNLAFKVLEGALGSLSSKVQEKIFGADGNRWYSLEVIYTGAQNTINYDSNSVVFHGWPIFELDPNGNVQQVEDASGVDLLASKIEQMQKAVRIKDWRVRGPSLVKMKQISDGTIVQKALSVLDGMMSRAGVNDSSTIYDYLRALMHDEVKKLGLPRNLHDAVLERTIESPGAPGIPELRRIATTKDQKDAISEFIKSSEATVKALLQPLEQAITDFAVEVLRGIDSTLIARSDAEVDRLKARLTKAISAIESSGNDLALDVLKKEMTRLKSIDNLSAAMEGIVFFYKGNAYKFTGQFAPAHQILSLFTFGRKGIPKMDLGESILREGGGATGSEPITLEEFHEVWEDVVADLEDLGCKDVAPIGSTGKKSVMGDIDVAAAYDGKRDDLFAAASAQFGSTNVSKVGSNIVSIAYPVHERNVQLDVMLGNTSYLSWSRIGTSSMNDHPDFSLAKGAIRNVLLNTITRIAADDDFPGEQGELSRTKLVVDFDAGLFKVVQTKTPSKPGGKPLASWKTLSKEFITDDPNEIVKHLFGPGVSPEDVRTLEGTINAIRASKKLRPISQKILNTFVSDLPELVRSSPQMFGDDPQGVLVSISNLLKRK